MALNKITGQLMEKLFRNLLDYQLRRYVARAHITKLMLPRSLEIIHA